MDAGTAGHGPGERWGKQPVPTPEIRLLEGPAGRGSELVRVLRIAWELLRGFRALHFVGPCVTVFGSARLGEDHPSYRQAREMGQRIARLGFTVMTGGGPGVMEAANRGAKDVGGRSVGCNIVLPKEQQPNAWLDRFVTLRYFFVRKVLLIKYSYAFVVLPGGFGTLDELFEAATLIQTGKVADFPIVLLDTRFWRPLREQLERMVAEGTLDAADLERLTFTDSTEEAAHVLEHCAVKRFGLEHARLRPHRWWLGERPLAAVRGAEPGAGSPLD